VPARIYALAKELNVDSKDLVDLVKKVGITGKGSALASLTDEEAQKVRDHLASSNSPAPEPVQDEAPAAVREAIPTGRKPIAIRGRKAVQAKQEEAAGGQATDSAAESQDSASDSPSGLDVQDSVASSATLPGAAPTQPVAPEKGTPGVLASRIKSRMSVRQPGPPTSPDAVVPVRPDATAMGGGKMRSLGRGIGGDKRGAEPGKPKRREPRVAVKMASLPDVAAPAPTKSTGNEPKAQKPDVKLSPDHIAGHRQGMRAPLEQLAQEDSDKKRGGAKRGGAGLAGFTGDKPRKAVDRDFDDDKPRKKLAGMASPRAERTRGKTRGRISLDSSGQPMGSSQRSYGRKRKGVNTAAPRKEAVAVELPCSIRAFSEAAGVSVGKVLGTLMSMGLQGGFNINSELDLESAELIATELDLSIQLRAAESLEDAVISGLEEIQDDPDSLLPRPPIVTFLGHVDHGKTSLLDYLIGIDVVSGEAGGITQHIRAYEIQKEDGRSVTFVDTPGHEAFTEMRARGANVTDIAVLVVAADDGIMPQTEEAISHAKAAEVPIVVALNKIDLEGVDPNRVMTQLTEHQLTPSEWGGDVEVVHTSAIKGTGMDELLETLLTIAELNEYTANPNRSALGVCLESEQQGDRGVVAKLIVQTGTLSVGDVVVCGSAHGRVRAMSDTLTGKSLTTAGPSTPVSVMGFDQPPGAGERFHVLDDISKAREIAADRARTSSQESLSGISTKVSFENFQAMLQEGRLGQQEEKVKLNLIVRADVKGSLEAIDKELSKLDNPEVEVRVLQRSVGGVTLADVTLASASNAVIAAFNVIPDEQARSLADERNVEVRRYDVIYKLTDDIKAMIEGRLKPEERVVELGRALVKQVFSISRVGTIAGCYVAQGSIQRGCRIRVNRDGRTIGDYALDSLKRIKEDVKEVPRGMECGIRLQGFNDIKQDDMLEAYRIEEVARTLD
jgi:translation initiation factor IF-2